MQARFQAVLCAVLMSLLLLPSAGVYGDEAKPKKVADISECVAKTKLEAMHGINLMLDGKYEQAMSAFGRCAAMRRDLFVKSRPPMKTPPMRVNPPVQAVETMTIRGIIDTAPQEPRFAESRLAPFETPTNAEQLIRLLETSIAVGDKTGAEELLTKIERLIPEDPRIVWMQRVVANMPGQKNQLVLDLGDRVELEMVRIEPGAFMMGAADGDPGEGPVHRVVISKPYYIGKYPVTQKQWETIMGDNPSHYRGPRNPVESVDLNDCERFIGKLSGKFADKDLKFSLPTSAQWEYACRAGGNTRFHFGDHESQLRYYGWFGLNSDGRTHPVGEKKPNAWGLYDMHGNVWEICSDFWDNGDYYANSPAQDPPGASGSWARVLRGGSYSASIARCRSASRFPGNPSVRTKNAGLRVVCTQ
ncbi:MAG: formylglycine-generating enzyme family protein [Pirellulales bacterium]|nr:formylglycine-generating enzyme family protein [Pirellulales bacterium]